jgi:hypothetical protein
VIQGVAIFSIGKLTSHGPVPITLGPCGVPNTFESNQTASLQPGLSSLNFSIERSHTVPLYEEMANLFSSCQDTGNQVTCQGPLGDSFSWDIYESNSSYCWFGQEYCIQPGYSSAGSIVQCATISPEDLGTTRKSSLSITYISECSHINNTALERHNETVSSSGYTVFEWGPYSVYDSDPLYQNATLVVFDEEAWAEAYLVNTCTYPDSSGGWTPAPFLTARLNDSYININNHTGPSQLTLIANRLYRVDASLPNNDPFFRTENVTLSGNILYGPGRIVATMACREQMRPLVNSLPANQSENTIAIGLYEDLLVGLLSYIQQLPQDVAQLYWMDFFFYCNKTLLTASYFKLSQI